MVEQNSIARMEAVRLPVDRDHPGGERFGTAVGRHRATRSLFILRHKIGPAENLAGRSVEEFARGLHPRTISSSRTVPGPTPGRFLPESRSSSRRGFVRRDGRIRQAPALDHPAQCRGIVQLGGVQEELLAVNRGWRTGAHRERSRAGNVPGARDRELRSLFRGATRPGKSHPGRLFR